MLKVVHARFAVDWTRPAWIEDELIRQGAREAHLVSADDSVVVVTVCAASIAEAELLVRDLLDRVGAVSVEILRRLCITEQLFTVDQKTAKPESGGV